MSRCMPGDTVLLEYVQPASAGKARSALVLRLATVMQARPYLEVHTMKGFL